MRTVGLRPLSFERVPATKLEWGDRLRSVDGTTDRLILVHVDPPFVWLQLAGSNRERFRVTTDTQLVRAR